LKITVQVTAQTRFGHSTDFVVDWADCPELRVPPSAMLRPCWKENAAPDQEVSEFPKRERWPLHDAGKLQNAQHRQAHGHPQKKTPACDSQHGVRYHPKLAGSSSSQHHHRQATPQSNTLPKPRKTEANTRPLLRSISESGHACTFARGEIEDEGQEECEEALDGALRCCKHSKEVARQHEVIVSRTQQHAWSYQPRKGWHAGDVAYFDIENTQNSSPSRCAASPLLVRRGSPLPCSWGISERVSSSTMTLAPTSSAFELRDAKPARAKSVSFDAASTDYRGIMRIIMKTNTDDQNALSAACTHQDHTCNKSHCTATAHANAPASVTHTRIEQAPKKQQKKQHLDVQKQNSKHPGTNTNTCTRKFDRHNLWQGTSIFEMDFRIYKGIELGMMIFIIYIVLILLVMVKVATVPPHRIANMKVQ
jgi:hypothetical protein